jgi:hypothetical protein
MENHLFFQLGYREEVYSNKMNQELARTLALTLSNDGGLTIEKQIRKTSV